MFLVSGINIEANWDIFMKHGLNGITNEGTMFLLRYSMSRYEQGAVLASETESSNWFIQSRFLNFCVCKLYSTS
jgi:hypothetical protein